MKDVTSQPHDRRRAAGRRADVAPCSSQALAATKFVRAISPCLHAIAADTLTIAKSGDFVAAEQRITDFETSWDAAESTMRPMDIGRLDKG